MMATALLKSAFSLSKQLKLTEFVKSVCHPSIAINNGAISQLVLVRHGSFFNKKSDDELWTSITTVSNQGKQRGRASRGKLRRKDNLKIGLRIGVGESNMQFPGLNSQLKSKSSPQEINKMYQPEEKNANFKQDVKMNRENFTTKKRPDKIKGFAIDRGFSGPWDSGRSIGPPEPSIECDFAGFDSTILEEKQVTNIKRTGSIRSRSVLVAVGNKEGLIGFGKAKSMDYRAAVKNARDKAAKRLMYIDRYDEHALMHSFHEQFHKTKIIAFRKEKGYGLVCHRVIAVICKLVGIKDIYAKVEGAMNPHSIMVAFCTGLQNQKSYQEMADETGHHVVEYKEEHDNFPTIMASPNLDNQQHLVKEPEFTLERYLMGGKVPYLPNKKERMKPTFEQKQKDKHLAFKKVQKNAKLQRRILGLE